MTQAASDGDVATNAWTMSSAGLQVEFDHFATGLGNSLADARAFLLFTPDEDVAYSFSGPMR
jgi:hypothetical protein